MGQIPRIQSVGATSLVPVENSSEALWARTPDGRAWVLKWESDTGFQPLLAESLAWLIGNALHVPQPAGAILETADGKGWLSERVAPILHWTAAALPLLTNPAALGATLAFDAIVMNEDRHLGNLLVQPYPDAIHLRLWAIDSGRALIGWIDDFAAAGLSTPSLRNLAPGLRSPPDNVCEAALQTAQFAQRVGHAAIVRWVDEACDIVRESNRRPLVDALVHRMERAPVLVRDYLDKLRAEP